ncbi:BON domain-containing protein [Rubrivirga sp. IMCC45206]|uniref:BON domain-containing protein n=1 Tax=Rubrivirga sp. IMCC45206 TaxID=3391614 RepID=UPI00398FB2ED
MPVSSQVLGYGLPPALRRLVDRHQAARAKTTADQSLARRLRDNVRAAKIPASGLAFYVHDGAISIYGTVPDGPAREGLLAVATGLPGVRRIVDHLRLADA